MRYARVYDSNVERVKRYLPGNYRVAGEGLDEEFGIAYTLVEGTDLAGWTLDGYVIPRLASGLIRCVEVEA